MKKLAVLLGLVMTLSACNTEPTLLKLQDEMESRVQNSIPETQEIEMETISSEARPFGLHESYAGAYYGQFKAKGYVDIVEVDEAFCTENCKKYEYVFFIITETENPNVYTYLEQSQGNSFVRQDGIGLGCIQEDEIVYVNATDANGIQNHVLDKKLSAAIINSNQENLIELEITRELFTSGSGAPTCYSHFGEVRWPQN